MVSSGRKRRASGEAKARTVRSEYVLVAILAIALLVRMLFLLDLRDTPFYSSHYSDSRIYFELAERIVDGQGIGSAFFMSPLYPYFIATVWSITGDPLFWVRAIQILLGCCTALLLFYIGRDTFGRTAGYIAAALLALHAPSVYYDSFFLVESIHTFLIVAALYFLQRAMREDRLRDWLLSAVTLGLAIVSRSSIILFVPLFMIVVMFRLPSRLDALRNPLIWLAVIGITLIPTTVHNYTAEAVFLPITSSFGYNLYAGNNEQAIGLYSMPEAVDLYSDPNGHAFVERMTGTAMNAAEVSSWWRNRAVTWIMDNPGEFLLLYVKKLILFFHPGEIDQLGLSMDFFSEHYAGPVGLPKVATPLIFILSFAGMFMALKDVKVHWPLLLFLVAYIAVTALFFVNGRLRLPVTPLLFLYAAYAVSTMLQVVRSGKVRTLVRPAIAAAALALPVFLLQAPLDIRYELEYLKLGQIHFDAGDYAEAGLWFERSVDERETVDGRMNLANALAAQENMHEAVVEYRAALALDSTSALTWFNFGNLWMQVNNAPRAHACWTRAIEYNPDFAPAHRNLGILLMHAERYAEAEKHFERFLELERNPEQRRGIEMDLKRMRETR